MIQSFSLYIILPIVMFSICLVLYRLVIGPTLADRVVAMDLITTLALGVIVVYAIATNDPLLLDVATVVAIVAFLGTIAFAYYVERRA